MTRVFLSPPDVGPEERRMLLDAFDSNWIAPTGPDIAAFEEELSDRVGVAHAVALSSGTAALHLALLLAGVDAGDEVIVPSFTFIATVAAVTYLGARPIFVDCSAESWNVDPALVEELLVERARSGRLPSAVVTVDLYGDPADYGRLEAVCRQFDVPLLEDSAEALGATYGGRAAGSFGLAGVFSFNGNKIITTSGGGMLVTESRRLAEQARHLANQAREPFVHFEHNTVGFNYRLSNLLSAIGRAQLKRLTEKVERRGEIDAAYRRALAGRAGISFMPHNPDGTSNYWLSCVEIEPEEFGSDREQVRLALEEADIESRPTWKPLHLQPAFAELGLVGPGHCSQVFARGLCLPTGSSLSHADQSRVIEIIATQNRN